MWPAAHLQPISTESSHPHPQTTPATNIKYFISGVSTTFTTRDSFHSKYRSGLFYSLMHFFALTTR